MLYPKKNNKETTLEIFKNPTSEYRGAPFWAWNATLNEDLLRFEIRELKKMGMGGFYMHSRTGLNTPYLSEEFMKMVNACIDEAKKQGMYAYLYDEDRFSSGQAGGLAMVDPRRNRRYLDFVRKHRCEMSDKETAYIEGKDWLIATFDIELNADGKLVSSKIIGENDKAEYTKWYAYCRVHPNEPWTNYRSHMDLSTKESVDEFIKITYDAYQNACGDEYGKTVKTMFTDEPQLCAFGPIADVFSEDAAGQGVWAYDMEKTYYEQYGADIIESLPEIYFDTADNKPSLARYRYFNHIAERLSTACLDNCADRCEKDGLLFTGHMLAEDCLLGSVPVLGDIMRTYRKMHIPGIDLLFNRVKIVTAKQCQSVVRQNGREGMMSEEYGITHFNFDLRGHKHQGDWQAALGVTHRVHHLAFYSMEGPAKRDYPASINYQAPWYKEYSQVEDHFARVASILTRGKAICPVAVIHPTESFWLTYGPGTTNNGQTKLRNDNHLKLAESLVYSHFDFDYICESLLPEQLGENYYPLQVGDMQYKVILLHDCTTLRKTTVNALLKFIECGGRVIAVDSVPQYEDLKETESIKELASKCEVVPFNAESINNALESERLVSMTLEDGTTAPSKIYQLRKDGDTQYLFIANTDLRYLSSDVEGQNVKITLKGEFTPTVLNTQNGECEKVAFKVENGYTSFNFEFYPNTSLLVKLDKVSVDVVENDENSKNADSVITLSSKVDYELDNYNVFLLDSAEFSLNNGSYLPKLEILRLDNVCREMAGLPERTFKTAQPWLKPDEEPKNFITMRFVIPSEIDVENVELGIERLDRAKIVFNGKEIESLDNGYFIDHAIRKVKLGNLNVGENILLVTVPLTDKTDTEWCYLLGDFGVKVEGAEKTVIAKQKQINYTSTTSQGMPFYGHNVIYKDKFSLEADANVIVSVKNYNAQLLRVFVDGEDKGSIIYSPYKLKINNLSKGEHSIEIKAYGSLINTLGSLHDAAKRNNVGPRMWQTLDNEWTDEYMLRDFGIIEPPVIEVYNK